jgi:uncharacterized protein with HEPN domain
MKSCLSYRENISAYIDGELDEVQRLSFEEHIEKCHDCKRELDEMTRIVSLCVNLPQHELPAEFQAELHEKLLAVADRKAVKDRKILKTKNFLFSKTFASMAAGVLLIFLAGTFVRFGLFSSKMTADSAADHAVPEMAMAEADLYSASAAEPEKAFDGGNTGAGEPFYVDDGSAGYGVSGYSSIENGSGTIDRSGTIEGRKSAMSIAELPDREVVLNKMSTITVTAEDLSDVAEKVRLIAIENSGEELKSSEKAPDDVSYNVESLGEASATSADIFAQKNEDDSFGGADEIRTQITFVFPQTQYERFVNELSNTLGAANVHMGAFVSEDMTDTINSMIEESEKIDIKLQEYQKEDKTDTDTIAKLKQTKEEVDGQIEIIRLGSDFVTVTITINQK